MAADMSHDGMAELPIKGMDKPCLLCPEDKKWFESRELFMSGGEVCFNATTHSGTIKKFFVSECVIALAWCDKRKPEGHPHGPTALRLWVKLKTPDDIKKQCLSYLKNQRCVHSKQ